ncbi:Hypothetical predicted protein, partial [Marmota monax]
GGSTLAGKRGRKRREKEARLLAGSGRNLGVVGAAGLGELCGSTVPIIQADAAEFRSCFPVALGGECCLDQTP